MLLHVARQRVQVPSAREGRQRLPRRQRLLRRTHGGVDVRCAALRHLRQLGAVAGVRRREARAVDGIDEAPADEVAEAALVAL